MAGLTWIDAVFSGWRPRRKRASRTWHKRGGGRSLYCQPLEPRRLLTITVNTLIDEADGSIGDGDIALRDAIALAPGGETIDFDAAINGGAILLTLEWPCFSG